MARPGIEGIGGLVAAALGLSLAACQPQGNALTAATEDIGAGAERVAVAADAAAQTQENPLTVAIEDIGAGAERVTIAADAAAQTQEGLWNVICGLPQQDNPFLALLPTGGYTGPWIGHPRSGHLEVKMLNRLHPEGGVSTEMWLLSRSVGWWRLKAIRVHPDDLPKLSENMEEDASWTEIRQIIESPFLSRPAVVRTGNPDDEELVNGQIFALLPDAFRLRCAP